ncbi:hypothetical protein KCV07_g6167, partial [Aureobasidium melanogenum]
MAVLDGLPGIEVTVVVDGKDLHEYQDAGMEDDEDTVTKYIEAVDNANFAIKIKVTKDAEFKGNRLSFKVLVDGSLISRPLVGPLRRRTPTGVRMVNGIQVGDRHIRKLKFDALESVTEHGLGLPEDLQRVKNLGKIEVQVTHKNTIRRTSKTYGKPGDNSDGFISEKAVKGQAVTHSYSLDKETYRLKSCAWKSDAVDGVKDPAAVFVFHYRSKAALKKLMIIPRTPSPVPLEDRPINELSPEEMAELLRRYKANASSTAEIKKELKRERDDDDDDDDDDDNNSRARKRARTSASADPAHLELNDDDTFTEVAVAPKEKTIISLDD